MIGTGRGPYDRQETNSYPSQLFFLTGHKEEESRKSVAGLLRKKSLWKGVSFYLAVLRLIIFCHF